MEMKIQLPLFQPDPACGHSNTDFLYQVSGNIPTWATFYAEKRTVEMNTDLANLLGSSFNLKFTATFESIVKEISFKVNFVKKDDPKPPPADVPTIPNPENPTEPSEKEEEKEKEKEKDKPQQSATTWDGWKALIDFNKLIPGGLKLPAKNPDPTYVSSPPKPALKSLTGKGKATIKFSEPVFEYQNLKDLKITKLV